MGIMSAWVISIAGAVVLINVCEILLPSGEMSKYIKGTLAVVCMLVMLAPLPEMLSRSTDIGELILGDSAVSIDYSFVDYVNRSKAEALSESAQKSLEQRGITGAKITVTAKASAEFFVESVFADLSLASADGLSAQQLKIEVTAHLCGLLNINSGQVTVHV